MLSTCPPIGFILTTDSIRARRFYVDLLGLTFIEEDSFALVVKSGGIQVRIAKVDEFTPTDHTIFGWEVPDIAATAAKMSAAGISFLRYSFLEQDAQGIWTAPSGTRVTWFNDPDGNILSLGQFERMRS